jgi:hypothetical protein
MRKDGLGKFYDRLKPEERFQLVVEAKTRGDRGESRRLVQSAPRYTYEEADLAYTSRVRASHHLTWGVCLDLLPRLAKLRMANTFSKILPRACDALVEDARSSYLRGKRLGVEEGWRAAGRDDEPPEEEPKGDGCEREEAFERMNERMEWASVGFFCLIQDFELEIALGAQALWEAFGNFCRKELGLEPKMMVEFWFEAVLPEIEELESLTEDVELEQEKVEEHETSMRDGWSKLVKS